MTIDDDAADNVHEEPAEATTRKRRLRRYLLPLLLAVALTTAALSTGFAGWYFVSKFRPDLQTNDAVARHVVRVASEGTVALLSYSPETLGKDLDNAKSRVTENYLAYYQQFAEKVLGLTAMRGRVTTTASVIKAGVAELQPQSAVVLVFIKWKTSSNETPQPVVTSGKLKVALAKVKDSWLIDSLESI